MKALFYLLLLFYFITHCNQSSAAEPPPIFNINIPLSATTSTMNAAGALDQLTTKDRMERLSWLSTHEWQQAIIAFDSAQLNHYINSLTDAQLTHDIRRFNTQEDEHTFTQQLQPEKQHFIPTLRALQITRQREKIHNTPLNKFIRDYKEYAPRTFYWIIEPQLPVIKALIPFIHLFRGTV